MAQVDPKLGAKVHQHLVNLGLETPMIKNDLTDDQKIDKLTGLFSEFLTTIGLDLRDDSLVETPKRMAKMYVKEFFTGLNYDNFPKCTTVENKMSAEDEFVAVKNIRVVSMCEHHLLPFFRFDGGVVAYIPKDQVLGLSKTTRLVEFFAARPQVQERLTNQIAEALKVILDTEDVAVYIDSSHTCMQIRGVKDPNASTVTFAAGGKFKADVKVRGEFLAIAKSAMQK